MSEPVANERNAVRRKAIDHLKGQLASGEIKAMELRLLMDLLKQEEDETPVRGTPMAALYEDLPFENEHLISS